MKSHNDTYPAENQLSDYHIGIYLITHY